MIRRWIVPILVFGVVAAAAYQATLIATPFALMRAASAKAGKALTVNTFAFGPMTTDKNQTIVRPSPDLSYSLCAFDISDGNATLVRIEPVPGHYWSVSVYDADTNVAMVKSDRDTGGKPALLAIYRQPSGAGQAHVSIDTIADKGYVPVPVKYDRGVVLVRILLTDKAEFPAIDALRRKSFCRADKNDG